MTDNMTLSRLCLSLLHSLINQNAWPQLEDELSLSTNETDDTAVIYEPNEQPELCDEWKQVDIILINLPLCNQF